MVKKFPSQNNRRVSLAQFVEAYLNVGLGQRNKGQRFDTEEVGPI